MIEAIAFDAYGTLFDVYSVGALAEELFPGNGKAISELWRDKQIEYTRLRSMSSVYKQFDGVTEDALIYSCRKLKLELSEEAKNALMNQYNLLPAFHENIDVLRNLKSMGIKLAILSNGTHPMLHSIVEAAGMDGIFSHVLSADTVGKYKSAPEVYQLGPDAFCTPVGKILFVSSNCWDACGATWFGYKTFWVNRAGAPLEELGVTPHKEGSSLQDVLTFVKESNSVVQQTDVNFSRALDLLLHSTSRNGEDMNA